MKKILSTMFLSVFILEFCSIAASAEVSGETYGFSDLREGTWYYEIMLKATSAYDDNGYVDLEKRGIRNVLDDYR